LNRSNCGKTINSNGSFHTEAHGPKAEGFFLVDDFTLYGVSFSRGQLQCRLQVSSQRQVFGLRQFYLQVDVFSANIFEHQEGVLPHGCQPGLEAIAGLHVLGPFFHHGDGFNVLEHHVEAVLALVLELSVGVGAQIDVRSLLHVDQNYVLGVAVDSLAVDLDAPLALVHVFLVG
jgi:hypothetical protein